MLPNESPAHYEYFKYFLSLGANGKVYEVADYFEELKTDHTYNLSHEYNWLERKKAYQVHLNKLAQAEIEKTVKEMARRQASNAMLNESAIMLPVKALLKKIQREGTDAFDNMSVKELMKLSFESARLHPQTISSERLSRNQATEISKTEMEVSQVQVILPNLDEEEV